MALSLIVRVAVLYLDVLGLDEALLLQSLPESGGKEPGRRRRCATQKTDCGHSRLLRSGRHRPTGRRPAQNTDKFTPIHA